MYNGSMLVPFVLKNVELVEMHLGGVIVMKDLLLMFSSYLPLLQKLTLHPCSLSFFNEEVARMFYDNLKLSNLHQLTIKSYGAQEFMPALTYYIRAAPLLQSFVLEVYGITKIRDRFYFENSLPQKLELHKYSHLKRVEFIGFRGTSSELSLAEHLLENGSALEQFIVDLRKRDNAHMIDDCYWSINVNGELPVGYPCREGEESKIIAFKAHVKEQLTKGMLHFNIL